MPEPVHYRVPGYYPDLEVLMCRGYTTPNTRDPELVTCLECLEGMARGVEQVLGVVHLMRLQDGRAHDHLKRHTWCGQTVPWDQAVVTPQFATCTQCLRALYPGDEQPGQGRR